MVSGLNVGVKSTLILRKIITYVRATVIHITCISPNLPRPIIIIDLYISVSRRRIPIAYIHRVCLLSYYMHHEDCLLSYFMHRGDFLLSHRGDCLLSTCSAGLGRSGTFMAIDMGIQQASNHLHHTIVYTKLLLSSSRVRLHCYCKHTVLT